MAGDLATIYLRYQTFTGLNLIYPEQYTITGTDNDVRFIFYIKLKNDAEFVFDTLPDGSSEDSGQETGEFIPFKYKNDNPQPQAPIVAFLVQTSVKNEDSYYVNTGIQNLTSALYSNEKETKFLNPHVNGNIKLKFRDGQHKLKNSPTKYSALANQDAFLQELEADSTLYESNLRSKLDNYEPRVLGSYDLAFARQVHLFYAPSELMYKDGKQVRLNPTMHFLKHRTFDAKLLQILAQLAFISTYAYDGSKKIIENFDNVTSLTDVDSCFVTQVFSRYLALLPNLVKYEYDYDFVLKKYKKGIDHRISDMFGDCLINFTGDCEDASRLVADIWRATASVEEDNEYIRLMKRVQAQFDLYCALCTIQTVSNMAHCTCILVPIAGKSSKFPFAIVEGTNAISPFAATGIPQALSRRADMSMLGQYSLLHDQIMKDETNQLKTFRESIKKVYTVNHYYPNPFENPYKINFSDNVDGQENDSPKTLKWEERSLFLLSVKPTLSNMDQMRVGKKDLTGRATSAKSWYGNFHEGFKISAKDPDAPPEPFLFITRDKKFYGVSAMEMKNGDFETASLSVGKTEQHRNCIENYKKFTEWHDSRKMRFKNYQGNAILNAVGSYNPLEINKNELNDPSQTFSENTYKLKNYEQLGLPVFTVFHQTNDHIPGYFLPKNGGFKINFKERLAYICLKIPLSGKNVSIYAGVHFIPTSAINVGTSARAQRPTTLSQAMATYRTVMAPFGAAAQCKLYPCSDASLVAAVAARYQQVTGQKLALRPNVDVGTLVRAGSRSTETAAQPAAAVEARTSSRCTETAAQPAAAMKAHPLSGCSGNLIQAIQALHIGSHMDETYKMQDASSYVFRNNSAEDVQKTMDLAENVYSDLGTRGVVIRDNLFEDHMDQIKAFAEKEGNEKHPVTLAWKKYNRSQNHDTFMKRFHHIVKEAGNMVTHSEKDVENFGVKEYNKVRDDLKTVKKDAGRKLSKLKEYAEKKHKELVDAGNEDVRFSEYLARLGMRS